MTRKTNTESNQRLDADPTLREIALDAVAIELGENPDEYDQSQWGDTDCGTACCIANKIVMLTTPGRRWYEEYKKKSTAEKGSHEWRQETIGAAATRVLGLKEPPRLFDPDWPMTWIEKAYESEPDTRYAGCKTDPTAKAAAMVLRTIMDGELPEALEASDILRCDDKNT